MSSNSPTVVPAAIVLEWLDDHTEFPVSSTTTRLLSSSLIFRIPVEFLRGASLLATQTMVLSPIFLYQIPMYQLFDLMGEKKPSSNCCLAETRVWSPVRNWVGVMRSIEVAR